MATYGVTKDDITFSLNRASINDLVKAGIVPNESSLSTVQKGYLKDAISSSDLALSERLYTIESRAAQSMYSKTGQWGSDRGPIASIKLITTNNELGGDSIKKRTDASGVNKDYIEALMGTDVKKKGYDRFLLNSCEIGYSEKTQIQTTFGDNEVIYFFGKNPVVINLSGTLVDSLHNNWFGEFILMYSSFLRGTKLAQSFEMLELVLPNMRVRGSILSLNTQQNSQSDTIIPFSMQFYAKEVILLPQPPLDANANNNAAKLKNAAIFSNTKTASLKTPTKTSDTASSLNGFTERDWGVSSLTNTVSSNYSYFHNNIITPVVSVIASITKFISNLANNIAGIIGAFTNPLNMILRDVTSIAHQATSIANVITSSISNIGGIITSTQANLRNTLSTLKNTAGVISRLPQDISSTFKSSFHAGGVSPRAMVLTGRSGQLPKYKKAALSSRTAYTVPNSFKL